MLQAAFTLIKEMHQQGMMRIEEIACRFCL